MVHTGLIPFFRTVVFDVLRRVDADLDERFPNFGGGGVAEPGVEPGPIVEDLDVFGNSRPGFCPGGEHGAVDKFVLQRRKERFGHSIIPALPHLAH